MASLIKHFGQPHHLSLQRIAELMDEPNIRSGDTAGFRKFALRVRALTKKLPQDLRAAFRRYLYPQNNGVPSLRDFAEWLEYELIIQEGEDRGGKVEDHFRDKRSMKRDHRSIKRSTTVLLGATQNSAVQEAQATPTSESQEKPKAYCPYCANTMHFLDQCSNFQLLTKEQKTSWVKSKNRCWRCGRGHQAAQCRLRVQCKTCRGKHLEALHEVNVRPAAPSSTNLTLTESKPTTDVLYLDRRAGCNQVLLKTCKVLLRNGEHTLETFAILDDGSERTILLQEATQKLQLNGTPENLLLRTSTLFPHVKTQQKNSVNPLHAWSQL
uniref:Peptidase aspartic putative domain-containing protein n=1 Tax=Knipowitschia caucasica TaxID=637954 RepID=A0AAV2IS96_KNICA